MGFLSDTGQTLDYQEAKNFIDYVKKHGIIQFLNLFKKFKDFKQDDSDIKWGDEVEYHLINIDEKTKIPRLQLNTPYIFNQSKPEDPFHLQLEYGEWMIEAVPTKPYDSDGNPWQVYQNLKARLETVRSYCKPGDHLLPLSVFPTMGVGDYFIHFEDDHKKAINKSSSEEVKANEDSDDDIFNEKNPVTKSSYIHDEIINRHPRFPTLTGNIRERRGEKVCILYPLYKDENTVIEESED